MTMNVEVINRGRGTRQSTWKWINIEVQDIDCLEKQREKTSQGAPVKKKILICCRATKWNKNFKTSVY